MGEAADLSDSGEVARLRAEIARLNKVVRVLIDRAERSTHLQGSDFNLFQTTLMLEAQVSERTAELRVALAENEKVNRALVQAARDLERTHVEQCGLIQELETTQRRLLQSEGELRRHRDHLSELVAEQTADLIRAKDFAEQASALKSEFLANMSHEFRTPLHAIASYAALGVERAARLTPEKSADYFGRIQQAGERLITLVDDLLDLAKLEARQARVQVRQADVTEVLAQVEHELKILLDAHGLTIQWVAHCQQTNALIDPERFHQVVRNLYANAIKYSPSGSVIEVSLDEASLPSAASGTRPALCLRVRDHGPGIPPGEEEAIFDKFVQSSKTKTGAGGVGLGLAISREIVRQHEGVLSVRNAPDGGAVFELWVPR